MGVIDVAGQVRSGETLDHQAVSQWLSSQGIQLEGEPEISQYSGGASNWTYRLKYRNQDFILRRLPQGTKAKSAHDMAREYQVQLHLAAFYPVVPQMVALCQDHTVIGCDFYVMQRIEGIIPRKNLPKGLDFSEQQVHELCVNMLDQLIALHQVPYQDTPLAQLGQGEGYCKRQVLGWDARFEKAKTLNVPSFKWVRRWLKQHIPEQSAICLIHNDWRFDNLILDPQQPTKIIGVLDWEMATLGDPFMDLGAALAYWIEAKDNPILKATRRQPTHLKGMFSRQQVLDYYCQKTGLVPENWTFYEVFGIFRLAVIAQQIYYRYYHKQTRNPAFKDFWLIIHALHVRALRKIADYELTQHPKTTHYYQKIKGYAGL